jgi:hypothetical protein
VRRLTLAAPLLLVLALAACGDDVIAKYRSGSENAANDFRKAAVPVLERVRTAQSARARIGALEAFRATVDRAARDFARLDPPGKVSHDNALLVSEFRGLSRDVVRYQTALRGRDAHAQSALAAVVQRDFGTIERTSARITAAVGA